MGSVVFVLVGGSSGLPKAATPPSPKHTHTYKTIHIKYIHYLLVFLFFFESKSARDVKCGWEGGKEKKGYGITCLTELIGLFSFFFS